MNPGIIGVIAFLAVGGGLYVASTTNVGDFFADRNEAITEVIEETAEVTGEALGIVGDAAEEMAEDATEAVEDAMDDMADAASDTMEAAEEAAEDAVEEIAALPEDAGEAVNDMLEDLAESDAAETLEELAIDMPETASAPGTTPVLDVVRVDPTGDVIVAGNAPEGERVGLLFNEEVIAEAEVAAGGDFVLVPDVALDPGEGSMEVVTLDDLGNVISRADTQIAVVVPDEDDDENDGFLVGVLRPGQPVEILEREAPGSEALEGDLTELELTDAAEDQIEAAVEGGAEAVAEVVADQVEETTEVASVAADDAAEAAPEPFVAVDAIELEGQRIWIAGASVPGTVLRLYQDNELIGETVTGEEGRFLYEGSLQDAEGEVAMRVDALAAGTADVVARAEVPFEMPVLATEVADAVEEVADTAEAMTDDMMDAADETVAEVADAAEAMADDVADMAEDAVEEAVAVVDEMTDDSAEVAVSETSTASTVEDSADAVETSAAVIEEPVAETAEVAEEQEVATADTSNAGNTTVIETANQRVSVLDTGQVIIRRGDNLWRISRRVFGQGVRYTSIYDANRDQIRDPALIFPGQVFTLPEADAEWGAVPGVEALEPDQIPTNQ